MAEILGAAASVVSIIDVLSRTIVTIQGLRSQWKDSDIALLSLTSQLAALSAALAKIQEWMESGIADSSLHHQLVIDLQCSIDCCRLLASKIYGELSELQTRPDGTLPMTDKAKFVFKSGGMVELQNMIDRQISALNLLLTACNSKTLQDQQKLLSKTSSRKRMDSVKEDSASLIAHRGDSGSIFTASTEKSSKLSLLFNFDSELFSTKVYKGMIRKTVKFSIRSHQRQPSKESSDFLLKGPSLAAHTSPLVTKKVLLLGQGEASKTTFLKQMQRVYNCDVAPPDREEFRTIIFDNMVSAIQDILDVVPEEYEHKRPFAMSRIRDLLDTVRDAPQSFSELLEKFYLLWTNHDIQAVLPADYPVPAVLDYFLLHRVRITSKGYIPTDQDILRAQVRTTGICKYSFDVKGSRYDVYDSGGQRSERKKWIRVFERVHTMVIFVPLGDYDLTLTEDQGCNRINEGLRLTDSLFNSKWFTTTTKILCFTKMDLFREKITSGLKPITHYLDEDYDRGGLDPANVESAKTIFTEMFTNLYRGDDEIRYCYMDVTNDNECRAHMDVIFR